jgi:polyisoprenoid-binding protein YceI
VEVRIPAASIDTGVADRDNHLRSPDFLDVERYPELTFTNVRVKDLDGNRFKLVGDLAIRDVTREVVLDAEFEGVARSPWGHEVIGFTASTEIDREDFGITWNQALETGGVLVGKKVKIEISAEAVRQA